MRATTAILFATVLALPLPADADRPANPELVRLLDEIKPPDSESPWREIAWLTDVTEARSRAVAENKPLVIFTAADGSPLSRT